MPIYNLYTSTIPFFFFILYDSIKLNYVNNQYLTIINLLESAYWFTTVLYLKKVSGLSTDFSKKR